MLDTLISTNTAEDALARAYCAITGEMPKWSDEFGYSDAARVIETETMRWIWTIADLQFKVLFGEMVGK